MRLKKQIPVLTALTRLAQSRAKEIVHACRIHGGPHPATMAALAAACFVAFSPGAAGAAVQASSIAGDEVGAPISWGACDPPPPPGVDLQCARIAVPLDWKNRGGRTISLAVIRLRVKPEERIGTLFINPGGPGDTGIGLVRGDPAGIAAIGGGRFDVVSWDPRGSNASTRVLCFSDQREEARFWAGASFPTTRAASERMLRLTADLAKRCGEVSGWLLPHISTADTARDLDHLRALLGEEKLTYVGLSYGTYLGQTYANMFPDRVRAMLLDGLIDAVEYSKSAEAREAMFSGAADAVFNQFLSLCGSAGPERCALAGGSQTPAERVESLFAQVKGTPIPAPGVRPPLLSPSTLSYSDLLLSQFEPMRAPSRWEGNAADLDAALRGDASALASGASGFLSPAGWAPAITSAAIQCADAPADRSPQEWPQVIGHLQQVGRLQGLIHRWWEWAPCASWPVRGEDNYRGPWNRSIPNPILLINQTYDPNTGYDNAVHAAHYLGNAVLLTQEGYGHLWFQDPSKCVEDKMVDYLVNLITPPPGTVCQSDHKPFDPKLKSGTENVEQNLP